MSELPTESRSVWETSASHFQRWRDGDPGALDDLVRLLSPMLWQVVRASGLDRATAEDVVQTTWLALVRSGESISEPRAVAGWLCTSARREAWRVAKQSTRQQPVEDEAIARRLPTSRPPRGRSCSTTTTPGCGPAWAGSPSAASSCCASWRPSRGRTTR